MARSGYEQEKRAIRTPNLTRRVEESGDDHFAMLGIGQVAASLSKYEGPEMFGYATVQDSAIFAGTLVLQALRRMGAVTGPLDGIAFTRAVEGILGDADLSFDDDQGDQSAAS